MRQAVMMGIASLLITVFMPGLLLPRYEDPSVRDVLLIVDQPKSVEKTEETLVRINTQDDIIELSLEEYLVGVVLSEMPASFHLEALKAQAVAARTFTMRQVRNGKHHEYDLCTNASCCQAWNSQFDLEGKLGNGSSVYWEKVRSAVHDTEGEVLVYDGDLIDAVYFSCSGGMTEDAAAVWGGDVPYLKSVVSSGEEQTRHYVSDVIIPFDQFCWSIQSENDKADFSPNPVEWFGHQERSSGGGVVWQEIGGESFSGTRLRAIFDLNSTNFTIAVVETGIQFEVKGYGHRVGMSQYGANAMANAGNSYKDILVHYYSGVEITKKLP